MSSTRQLIRCRLFPGPDHDEADPNGHGLTADDEWVNEAADVVSLWAIDLSWFGPTIGPERQRHFRMAQQIAEDLAVLIEAEGEKKLLLAQLGDPDTEVLTTSRSLKFVVDGQLDVLVSLAHLVANLVVRTLASHPRWRTAVLTPLPETEPAPVRAIRRHMISLLPDDSGDLPEYWVSANKQTAKLVESMQDVIGDPGAQPIVDEFGALATTNTWLEAIWLRGERHHQDGRGLPEGLQTIPFGHVTAGAYGGPEGATFFSAQGPINTDQQARERLHEAAETAARAVPAIAAALGNLFPAWQQTFQHIDHPDLVEPWLEPRPPEPTPTQNGKNLRWEIYIRLSQEAWTRLTPEVSNELWSSDDGIDCRRRGGLPDGTVLARLASNSYGAAVDRLRDALAAYDVDIEDHMPALLL